MSAINVAASPAPVVSPAPAASDAATAAAAPQAPDGQQGSAPFAAVLKQQMAQPADAKAPAVKADVQAIIQAEAPQESGLAALLPMLMGAAGMASTTANGDPASLAPSGKKAVAEDVDDTASPDAALALAAMSIPVTPQAATTASTTGEAAKPAAMPAASAPAILAAATETEAKPVAEKAGNESFDALLAGSREISAASLAHAQATAAAVKHETPVASARIDTPVGAQGWDAEVGDKLVWMAGNKDSRAELVLTPPQLGRIEISLSVTGDQATASFVSASPAVRDALENALPRLREILADAGVTLGQAQVGSDSPGQSAERRENGDNPSQKANGAFGLGAAAPLPSSPAAAWSRGGRGMVDIFA